MPLKRRKVLRYIATSPVVIVLSTQPATGESSIDLLKEVTDDFFSPLRGSEDKTASVVSCANEFCIAQKEISSETIDEILDSGEMAETGIRRARFGVRLLREYGITDAVDESMLESGERSLNQYTRYLPLLGSFNNCHKAACAVDEDNPETIERFLFASMAFGIEVALWYYGAPFQMAWRGTRFIANRTFLRLARNGCRLCVAFAMSEIHWAIRGKVYNLDEMVTEEEFVIHRLSRLQQFADEIGYDVNIQMSNDEVTEYLESASSEVGDIGGGAAPIVQQREGIIDRLIPDFNFDTNLGGLLKGFF